MHNAIVSNGAENYFTQVIPWKHRRSSSKSQDCRAYTGKEKCLRRAQLCNSQLCQQAANLWLVTAAHRLQMPLPENALHIGNRL